MPSTATSRIEGVTASLAVKTPCRAATTGNISLVGLQTIDGVALAAGDRVLVRAQTDAKANGLYDCDTGGWTRSRDFDGLRDATKGTMIFVTDGATWGGVFFTLDTALPVIGTSAITFTPRSAVTGNAEAEDIGYDNAGSDLTAANVQAALSELAGRFLGKQGTSIASAATTNIGGADSDFIRVTGTTTITSLGAGTKHHHAWIKFTGILTLTHNATGLILPGSANIVTAAGDIAEFVRISGSDWQCIAYHRATGLPLNKSSQAQAEGGTDDTSVMTPLRTAQAIAAQAQSAPVGAIIAFAMQTPPGGWLECAGQLLTQATYPALFAAIGTAFNVGGEAATDFRLPDLRGEFMRGWDNGRGADTGRTFGSSQQDALQDIDGSWYSFPNTTNVGTFGATGAVSGTTAPIPGQNAAGAAGSAIKFNINASAVARTASETRGRNVAVMFCIKAFGVTANQGAIDITSLAADVAAVKTNGFSKSFVSAEQTVTAGGTLTLAHGMGTTPKQWKGTLVCKIAEQGYSVGDVVEILGGAETTGSSNAYQVTIVPGSTSLFIRFGNGGFILQNKSNGTNVGGTAANWRFVAKAWA